MRKLERAGIICANGLCDIEQLARRNIVEAHAKDEAYPFDPLAPAKPPRLICARDDCSKMVFGPLFAPLDDALFNSRFSVKHVPDSNRPAALIARVGDGFVLVCDYTAFESCQRAALQNLCEFRVYRRCLEYTHNVEFVEKVIKILGCDQRVVWGNGLVTYEGPCLRFSGEVTTSLGNTINNICCITYARAKAEGLDLSRLDWDKYIRSIPLVCEGDDSIQTCPSSDGRADMGFVRRFIEALESCGLEVKPEVYARTGEAAYCATRWNPHTGHRYCRDLIYTMGKMCWTSSSSRHLILRAMKAQAAEM